jgi:hypothetical protein
MSPPLITKSATIGGPELSDNNTNNSVSNNVENAANYGGSLPSPDGLLMGSNNTSLEQIPSAAISADDRIANIPSLANYEANNQLSSNVSEQQYTTGIIDQSLQNPQLSTLIEPYLQSNSVNNDFDIQQPANLATNPGAGQTDEFLAGNTAVEAATTVLPSNTIPTPQPVPPLGSPTISANPFDNAPPETVIVSAIDSTTGMAIQSGSTATSNSSVTFAFEGFDDSGISGYSCSIENLEPFSCSSPVIYDTNILQGIGIGTSISNNPLGHSFQVSAIDNSGNVDPTPAVFNWNGKDSIDAETLAPETLAPETLAPETLPPNTIAPSQLPVEQQQQPQITVPGPLLPNIG